MKTARYWILGLTWVVAGLVSTSCLNSSDPIDRVTGTRNVTGRWAGTTSLGETVLLDLDQTVTSVTGTARIGEISSDLTGTVDGNRFEATLPSQPVRQIFSTVTSTSIGGTIRDFRAEILSTFSAELQ